jgi:DHA3 family macrolide efflux protein-like MFS transporter
MKNFYVLWAGQFVSIFASRMTWFALTLWAWDLAGSATALVMVGIIGRIPDLILSPFAGALVDRWDRKLLMGLSDAGAAFSTLLLLIVSLGGNLQLWHLYIVSAIGGIFGVFQYPAYAAAVSTMVPKDQFARANSMRSAIGSASGIGAPLLAGALIVPLGLNGILIIDLVTFVLAVGTLLVTRVPQPKATKDGQAGSGSIWTETRQGWRYIINRPSLKAIILLFTFSNIAAAFTYPLIAPMILAKTGDDPVALGTVQSVSSFGFLAGSLMMSVWPGPKRRIHGVNLTFILEGLLGSLVFGLGWSMAPWLFGAFFLSAANPIINSLYIAVMQSKIPQDLQGRFFGLENTISVVSYPIGQLLSGLISDRVFEPAMTTDTSLQSLLGELVGTGPGAGYGLAIVIGGVLAVITGLAGFAIRRIREIEDIMPDQTAES